MEPDDDPARALLPSSDWAAATAAGDGARHLARREERSSRSRGDSPLLRTTYERAVWARADDRNRGRQRAQTGGRGRTSLDCPERGRANPSPTETSIRACARVERTTRRRRRRHAIRRLDIGVLPEAPMVVLNQQLGPVEPRATTSSACLLHGLLHASPGGPHEVRHVDPPPIAAVDSFRSDSAPVTPITNRS